ncbi:MAG TPA: site-specific integrase [Blastocatellia bacterium]|nr:site-specific integrase [Blastocatellia bacterium]
MNNLRALCQVYNWAETVGNFNLDDFLTTGGLLDARQIESLAFYLRTGGQKVVAGIIVPADSDQQPEGFPSPSTFDYQLAVAEDFLNWALDSANRGGRSNLTLEQLYAQRARLSEIFRSLRIGAAESRRKAPLTKDEIRIIREAIAPETDDHGGFLTDSKGCLLFSSSRFSKETQLRNWLMFETALELGLRRGELLKLRLDSLPRGNNDGVRILRLPDDKADSRLNEPSVKTAERVIPASRRLLMAFRAYLTAPQPQRRISGKSPYLFVTSEGEPVSLDTANDIIQSISRLSGVSLSWHSLRHTWAETMAELLSDRPNGLDQLKYLGGWTNSQSPSRYIQNAIAKQATAALRKYQEEIYNLGEQQDESTETAVLF